MKVWFHRSRAACWAAFGLLAQVLGWSESIALVWWASVYANVVSDLGAGEAADDRQVLDRLDRIEARLAGHCPDCADRRWSEVDTLEMVLPDLDDDLVPWPVAAAAPQDGDDDRAEEEQSGADAGDTGH